MASLINFLLVNVEIIKKSKKSKNRFSEKSFVFPALELFCIPIAKKISITKRTCANTVLTFPTYLMQVDTFLRCSQIQKCKDFETYPHNATEEWIGSLHNGRQMYTLLPYAAMLLLCKCNFHCKISNVLFLRSNFVSILLDKACSFQIF